MKKSFTLHDKINIANFETEPAKNFGKTDLAWNKKIFLLK